MKSPKPPKYQPDMARPCAFYREIFLFKEHFGQNWLERFWLHNNEYPGIQETFDSLLSKAAKMPVQLNFPLILHELFCGAHEGLSWYSYQHREVNSFLEEHAKVLQTAVTAARRLRNTSQKLLDTSPYYTAKRTLQDVNVQFKQEYVQYEDGLYDLQTDINNLVQKMNCVCESWGNFEKFPKVSALDIGLCTLSMYFRRTLGHDCLPEIDALWSAATSIQPVDARRIPQKKKSSNSVSEIRGDTKGVENIKMRIYRFRNSYKSIADEIERMIFTGYINFDPRWQWPSKVRLEMPHKLVNEWSTRERPSNIDEREFNPRLGHKIH